MNIDQPRGLRDVQGRRHRVFVGLSPANAAYVAERMRTTGQWAGVVLDILVTECRLRGEGGGTATDGEEREPRPTRPP